MVWISPSLSHGAIRRSRILSFQNAYKQRLEQQHARQCHKNLGSRPAVLFQGKTQRGQARRDQQKEK